MEKEFPFPCGPTLLHWKWLRASCIERVQEFVHCNGGACPSSSRKTQELHQAIATRRHIRRILRNIPVCIVYVWMFFTNRSGDFISGVIKHYEFLFSEPQSEVAPQFWIRKTPGRALKMWARRVALRRKYWSFKLIVLMHFQTWPCHVICHVMGR